MSRLEELIAELCPDGVEYKVLGDVSEYSKTRIDASEIDEHTYVGVENLLPNKQGKTTSSYVPTEGKLIRFLENDILIGNIRPYLKKIWLAEHNGATNGDVLPVHITEKDLDAKFLYYCLSSDQFFLYDMRHAKGAKMPRGDKGAVMEYKVPVPPLEVQREIVRILDNFTFLSAELSAELSARRKQYEFYRHKMLSFNNPVPKVLLDEVADSISTGKNKDRLQEGAYPVYGSTGVIAKTNTPVYDHEQILIARVGANAGFVHLAKGLYDVSDNTIIVNVKKNYLLKYVYYILVNMNLNQYAKGGGQPLITAGQLKKLFIPMPEYEIQQRIINVLDNFDAICADLNIGLPAEIEARQKQYEYYRDLLLTFAENGSTLVTDRQTDRQTEHK